MKIYEIEPYLQNIVIRERQIKPQVLHEVQRCTLCNETDVQDVYHVIL